MITTMGRERFNAVMRALHRDWDHFRITAEWHVHQRFMARICGPSRSAA